MSEHEERERRPGAGPVPGDDGSLAGAWALDALSGQERAGYEDRLRRRPEERREADGLRETASRLGAASAVPPPARLRADVLAAIARTPQEPPAGTAPVSSLEVRRRRRGAPSRWSALVAAAGVLVAATGAGVALDARGDAERARQVAEARREQQRTAESTLEQVAALLASGDSVTVQVSSGGTATVVRAGDRAAVIAAGLPAAGEGHAYQLWLVHDHGVTPGAVMPQAGGQDGPAVALVEDLGSATGLGLSVEPAGGSQQPTTTPVVVAPLPA
ncbi:anti-sigma factor [Kineococcus esterisolvens]|uniref:anti-sigma factor n=1 Tax=unclassified Kineococcus TaxID=2621656 RepID=UPI003D7E3180